MTRDPLPTTKRTFTTSDLDDDETRKLVAVQFSVESWLDCIEQQTLLPTNGTNKSTNIHIMAEIFQVIIVDDETKNRLVYREDAFPTIVHALQEEIKNDNFNLSNDRIGCCRTVGAGTFILATLIGHNRDRTIYLANHIGVDFFIDLVQNYGWQTGSDNDDVFSNCCYILFMFQKIRSQMDKKLQQQMKRAWKKLFPLIFVALRSDRSRVLYMDACVLLVAWLVKVKRLESRIRDRIACLVWNGWIVHGDEAYIASFLPAPTNNHTSNPSATGVTAPLREIFPIILLFHLLQESEEFELLLSTRPSALPRKSWHRRHKIATE